MKLVCYQYILSYHTYNICKEEASSGLPSYYMPHKGIQTFQFHFALKKEQFQDYDLYRKKYNKRKI